MSDVSEIPDKYLLLKTHLTLYVMGLKKTTLAHEPVGHLPMLNLKIFYKILDK